MLSIEVALKVRHPLSMKMRTFLELERIIWRTSKVFVFGNPYNTVLATKPEAASCSRQPLTSLEGVGGIAEIERVVVPLTRCSARLEGSARAVAARSIFVR